MAEKKLEFRDPSGEDGENYLVKSRAELDLEARTAEDYEPDSVVGTHVLNPNPFGEDEYAGTDPIYQNASTKANAPVKADEDNAEAKSVKALREAHKFDESRSVDDPGTGGKAEKAEAGTGGASFRTILPGQEGYDLQKAEEQNGPPLRVYNDEEESESESEGSSEVNVPGTNLGATTEHADPDKDEPSGQAGSRTGNE